MTSFDKRELYQLAFKLHIWMRFLLLCVLTRAWQIHWLPGRLVSLFNVFAHPASRSRPRKVEHPGYMTSGIPEIVGLQGVTVSRKSNVVALCGREGRGRDVLPVCWLRRTSVALPRLGYVQSSAYTQRSGLFIAGIPATEGRGERWREDWSCQHIRSEEAVMRERCKLHASRHIMLHLSMGIRRLT